MTFRVSSRITLIVLKITFYIIALSIGMRYFGEGVGMLFTVPAKYYYREQIIAYAGPLSLLPAVLVSVFFRRVSMVWLLGGAVVSAVTIWLMPYPPWMRNAELISFPLTMMIVAIVLGFLDIWSRKPRKMD